MNVIEASSKISGLDQKTCKEIWAEVKANHKRLELCEGPHDFKPKQEDKRFSPKYVCTKCNGEVDGSFFHAYSEGIRHAQLKGGV